MANETSERIFPIKDENASISIPREVLESTGRGTSIRIASFLFRNMSGLLPESLDIDEGTEMDKLVHVLRCSSGINLFKLHNQSQCLKIAIQMSVCCDWLLQLSLPVSGVTIAPYPTSPPQWKSPSHTYLMIRFVRLVCMMYTIIAVATKSMTVCLVNCCRLF